jgi:hypothetical protein
VPKNYLKVSGFYYTAVFKSSLTGIFRAPMNPIGFSGEE